MPNDAINNRSYIFVLTYGRSGSTVLMRLLNLPETVEIRGENSNALFWLYKTISSVQRSKDRFGYTPRETSDPWFGADKIIANDFEETCLKSFVNTVLNPTAGSTHSGFKEICHLPSVMSAEEFSGYVEFILSRFSSVKIIFNTRDPMAVSRSGWFKDMPQDYVIAQVSEANKRFVAAAKKSKNCRVIDYSAVVENDVELKELFEWLEISFDQSLAAEILDIPLSHMKATTGKWKVFSMIPKPIQKGLRNALSKFRQ